MTTQTQRARPRDAAVAVGSLAAAAALLVVALPWLVGAGWTEIAAALAAVPTTTLVGLVAVWLAGLWAYTFVVTPTLPGLTRGRAFALNAVGGATSNLLPAGGALGAALTYGMARSWGHDRRSVVSSTLVSNFCNVVGRLVLPAVGLGVLLLAGGSGNGILAAVAVVGCVLSALAVGALAAAVRSESVAAVLGRALDAAAGRILPASIRPAEDAARRGLHRLRAQVGDTVRERWGRLCAAMGVTLLLQAALFEGCLLAAGVHVAPPVALAAFAVSRALTVVVLTPNGIGLSETGTATVLTALGAAAGPAAAAVLLFGLITHVLEIVLGVLAAGVWAAHRRAPQPV